MAAKGTTCEVPSPKHPRPRQNEAVPAPAPADARRLWRVLEPLHALIYFAPEALDHYRQVGLKGGWMGYFASRSAPMGPVPPQVVTATFFNFAPPMVERAIPDAWALAEPATILSARLAAADIALRRLLGDDIASPEVAEAAEIARAATEVATTEGRPLFGGHAALAWPDEPHLRLWHAATLLREHRGDGHVAVLTAESVTGLEAHILIVGQGVMPRSTMQAVRGWTDEEWDAAAEGLRSRNLIDGDDELTDEGRDLRTRVEARTDRLAVTPYSKLGGQRTERLYELARPLALRIVDQGGLPIPNPVGVPAP